MVLHKNIFILLFFNSFTGKNIYMRKTTKKEMLKGDLSMTTPVKKVKKPIPNIQEAEEITKEVYSSSTPKKEPTQKTTLDLPKTIHFSAKIMAMEKGVSLKGYIKELIEIDLKKHSRL